MDPANHMTWFNDGMLESTDQTTWHLITKQGLSTQPTPSMPTKPNDACTEHVIFDIFKLCRECLLGGQVNCFYPLSLAQDFSCKLSYSQNFPLSSQRLIDSSLLIFPSRTNDRILIYFIWSFQDSTLGSFTTYPWWKILWLTGVMTNQERMAGVPLRSKFRRFWFFLRKLPNIL